MSLWIALFRGINVGGRHVLPMKALTSLLQGLGCVDILTYIQSGNVIFFNREKNAHILAPKICNAVKTGFGFAPDVLLLTNEQLIDAHAANPFPDVEQDPKTLHLYFLAEDVCNADWAALDALKSSTEHFRLIDRIFYLHAPDGIGRSKLAAKVEKYLGVPATARNWRTVEKVLQLAGAAGESES